MQRASFISFLLKRLCDTESSALVAAYEIRVHAQADTLLVSRGVSVQSGAARQPDVLVSLTAASRVIHCVLENWGHMSLLSRHEQCK